MLTSPVPPATTTTRVTATPVWLVALPDIGSLTGRESEVFDLLGVGRSNREISSMLRVSECTVKKHVGAIMAKLGLQSRLQIGLAAMAHQFGCAN